MRLKVFFKKTKKLKKLKIFVYKKTYTSKNLLTVNKIDNNDKKLFLFFNIKNLIINKSVGDIAQLVERCFCTADVSGSNPLISTSCKFHYIAYF
jgi:hypothetical protein